MMLDGKVAVIYGGAGRVGTSVARVFAEEGAQVFLAGRSLKRLEGVAEIIRSSGGSAQTSVLDALDQRAVEDFVDGIVAKVGHIDISFNLISVSDVQRPLMEISLDDFLLPIQTAMRTQFITTRAAASHMMRRGSGVILAFGGSGPQTLPGLGGFKIALDAVEGLRRQWAIELGRYGIRVVTLKTGGIPETLPENFAGRDELVASLENATLLKRSATLVDVGNVAAFVASDRARTLTATDVNISCGAIVD